MATLISIFFAAMIAIASALNVPAQAARYDQGLTNANATSALAYRESLIDYLNANPTFTGVIPDASLTPLWGKTADPRWAHVVTAGASGSLYVYEQTPSHDKNLIGTLYDKTNKSHLVGKNTAGVLISAVGLNTGIAVPASVPEGAVLIYGK